MKMTFAGKQISRRLREILKFYQDSLDRQYSISYTPTQKNKGFIN